MYQLYYSLYLFCWFIIQYCFSTATGYQPAPQAGYAVPPATYTTPRAAATAYDVASYQTAAATQSAYGMLKLFNIKLHYFNYNTYYFQTF